jgi:hypothetical protein
MLSLLYSFLFIYLFIANLQSTNKTNFPKCFKMLRSGIFNKGRQSLLEISAGFVLMPLIYYVSKETSISLINLL